MSVSAANTAYLEADQRSLLLWTPSIVIVLAVLSVLLRFVSRLSTHVPLLLDDWLILATLPICLAANSITIWGTIYHHFGTHVLATATLDSLHNFLRGLFVFEITYAFTIAGAKFSMMALYQRILPAPHLRWPIRITALMTGTWLIATVLVSTFSCNPVQGFWMFEQPKICIDSLAFYIGSAVTNIAIDLALMAIPIAGVLQLHVSLSQKIAVCAIFGIGIFVTVCSGLRLNQLIIASSTGLDADPTWVLVGPALWSDIEIGASIICACLPTMRPLLRLLLRGTLKVTSNRSYRSGRFSHGHPQSLMLPEQYKGAYQRFSNDRPLSGIAGDCEWLGKGVGAPVYGYGVSMKPSLGFEMSEISHFSRLNTPPPAYHQASPNGRMSAMSNRPPVPTRSPFRGLRHQPKVQELESPVTRTPTQLSRSVSINSSQPISPLPATQHFIQLSTKSEKARPKIVSSGAKDTSLPIAIDEHQPAQYRMRHIVRDPETKMYVLSPRLENHDHPDPSDWDASWKEELDHSIDRLWDPSRATSRNGSLSGSLYEWGTGSAGKATAAAVDAPPLPVPTHPLYHTGDQKTRPLHVGTTHRDNRHQQGRSGDLGMTLGAGPREPWL